jgi:hypothetical protein
MEKAQRIYFDLKSLPLCASHELLMAQQHAFRLWQYLENTLILTVFKGRPIDDYKDQFPEWNDLIFKDFKWSVKAYTARAAQTLCQAGIDLTNRIKHYKATH